MCSLMDLRFRLQLMVPNLESIVANPVFVQELFLVIIG